MQATAYKLGAAPGLPPEQAQLTKRIGIAAGAMERATRLLTPDDSPAARHAMAMLGHAAADVVARLTQEPLPEVLRLQVCPSHVLTEGTVNPDAVTLQGELRWRAIAFCFEHASVFTVLSAVSSSKS